MAQTRKKFKFYQQIQALLEARLEENRGRLSGEGVRAKLERAERLERELIEQEQQQQRCGQNLLQLLVNREEIQTSIQRVQGEIGDYEVLILEKELFQEFSRRIARKLDGQVVHGPVIQSLKRAGERLQCVLNEIEEEERGFKFIGSFSGVSLHSPATLEHKKRLIQQQFKQLQELRAKLQALQNSVAMLRSKSAKAEDKAKALRREREEAKEYVAEMQRIERQLIELSLHHSKVVGKRRKAEERLARLARLDEERGN